MMIKVTLQKLHCCLLFLLFGAFHAGAGAEIRYARVCLKARGEWGEAMRLHALQADLPVLAAAAPKPCKTFS